MSVMMMMIDVLRPLLCTWWAKWAERPPKLRREVKDETPFRYAHAEIRTQMVVSCGLTHYQLDHGGALYSMCVSESVNVFEQLIKMTM